MSYSNRKPQYGDFAPPTSLLADFHQNVAKSQIGRSKPKTLTSKLPWESQSPREESHSRKDSKYTTTQPVSSVHYNDGAGSPITNKYGSYALSKPTQKPAPSSVPMFLDDSLDFSNGIPVETKYERPSSRPGSGLTKPISNMTDTIVTTRKASPSIQLSQPAFVNGYEDSYTTTSTAKIVARTNNEPSVRIGNAINQVDKKPKVVDLPVKKPLGIQNSDDDVMSRYLSAIKAVVNANANLSDSVTETKPVRKAPPVPTEKKVVEPKSVPIESKKPSLKAATVSDPKPSRPAPKPPLVTNSPPIKKEPPEKPIVKEPSPREIVAPPKRAETTKQTKKPLESTLERTSSAPPVRVAPKPPITQEVTELRSPRKEPDVVPQKAWTSRVFDPNGETESKVPPRKRSTPINMPTPLDLMRKKMTIKQGTKQEDINFLPLKSRQSIVKQSTTVKPRASSPVVPVKRPPTPEEMMESAFEDEDEDEEMEEEEEEEEEEKEEEVLSSARSTSSQKYGQSMDDDEVQQVDLIQCDICNRNFAADRIDKHTKVCQIASSKKRKKFAVNVLPDELAKEKKQMPKQKPQKEQKKISKWRQQHAQFQQVLKAGTASAAELPEPVDDRVECPHCNRKFADHTAQRHIPKCAETRSKPSFLKRGNGLAAGGMTNSVAPPVKQSTVRPGSAVKGAPTRGNYR